MSSGGSYIILFPKGIMYILNNWYVKIKKYTSTCNFYNNIDFIFINPSVSLFYNLCAVFEFKFNVYHKQLGYN